MNVLYITYGLPVPPDSGARLRDYQLIKRVARAHRVTVLSLLEFEDELRHADGLAGICQQVDGVVAGRGAVGSMAMALGGLLRRRPAATATYYYPELARKIRQLTASQTFDIVQFEHSFLAPYRDALAPGFRGATVLSLHNIGEQQYRSMRDMSHGVSRLPATLKWWLMKGWEATVAERFDHVITVSGRDRERLLEQGCSAQVSVIENGVDCSGLQPLEPPPEHSDELLFIGTMGYLPNRDAARYLCREILPLIRQKKPACMLNLVGSGGRAHLADLAVPGAIRVAGRVGDPLPYYRRSRVAVAPLRSGGGSRLKILESLALGRPVVSTTLGREGIDLQDGIDVSTADTPRDFADRVVRLLEDRALWNDRVREGRRTVEQHYDWELLAGRLLDLYDQVNGRNRR